MGELSRAQYHGGTSEFRYHDSDGWLDEFAELRRFYRRAFELLAYNGVEGDYVEFGCYSAETFRWAHAAMRLAGHPRHLWGFDSFSGLPEARHERDEHPRWAPRSYEMSEQAFVEACLAHGMDQSEFTTVPGYYENTLDLSTSGPRPERVAFAQVDCDLYSSATEVLAFLAPRMQHGMVISFDDYFLYSPTHRSGERVASLEFLQANPQWTLLPWLPIGWHGMSFIVERSDPAESYSEP